VLESCCLEWYQNDGYDFGYYAAVL
ncbi:hypothetical protein SCS_01904, partial [Enterococcus faecalis EnGen0117]